MLTAIFTYELTKLNLEDLSNENEELNIELNVTKDQLLEEVETTYETLGYDCR